MSSSKGAIGQAGAAHGPFIGRPMPRFEDLRLVRGHGNYTDDVSVPGRPTPCSCARRTLMRGIVSIDAEPARARSRRAGRAHRRATISPTATSVWRTCPIPPMPTTSSFRPSRRRRSGKSSTSCSCRLRSAACALSARRWPWSWRRRLTAARDAAEAVAVDYEVLPAVTDVAGSARATMRRRSGQKLPTISRSTTPSATAPRSRPRWRRPISSSSRPSAASARQRIHGAARGDRQLRSDIGAAYNSSRDAKARIACGMRRGLPQGAAGANARALPGRRRRLRIALQCLSGASGRGLGGASPGSAGEMDRRPARGVPDRLHRARRGHQSAARARSQRPHPCAGARAHRQYRGAYRLLRAAEQRLPRCADGLRRADRLGAPARRR